MGPVGTNDFGDPTIISTEEFETRIAGAILENLEKFGKEKFELERAIRRNSREDHDFRKRHLFVSVYRDDAGGLTIYPEHRVRGGSEGRDEDTITLSASDLPHKLPEAIAEAFRRAR